jgi:hypothetical protein
MDWSRAAQAIDRLLQTASPRARWLAIATCGARRGMREATLDRALDDADPWACARAYRSMGELGRSDLIGRLAAGLKDDDPECRFWSAWAAARMGAAEPLDCLAGIAWQGGPRAERALDLLPLRLQ